MKKDQSLRNLKNLLRIADSFLGRARVQVYVEKPVKIGPLTRLSPGAYPLYYLGSDYCQIEVSGRGIVTLRRGEYEIIGRPIHKP